MTNTNDAL